MNKLTAIVVGCLFLQLTSGASLPISRRETTRDAWFDLMQTMEQHEPVATDEELTVSAVIRYSTTEVVSLGQDEHTWFVGKLCGQSVGKALNVTMLLNNNPGWEPVKGVVDYVVIDSNFQDGRVLCSNKDSDGYATPYCLVESWPNKYDLIIVVRAGPVSGIAFSTNAEFFDKDSETAVAIRMEQNNPGIPTASLSGFNAQALPQSPIFLTQSVSTFPAVSLGYLQKATVKFSWCSSMETQVFQMESTVTSSDGESSYAQYICEKQPCDVGVNNIAHNGEQLSSNTILTDPLVYKDMYIVIVNWGGAFDEDSDTYRGNFLYNANQVRLY